ncbi:MAG: hypothetical protein E7212_12350 [Clostridium sartagoforme]|nr:hypothetical protein [Clostridium sartagoforme]
MSKRFIKISFGIFIFLAVFLFSFKFLLGNRFSYWEGTEKVPKLTMKYKGVEEDKYSYRIRVSFKNNSKHYARLDNIKFKFSTMPTMALYLRRESNPEFNGYDLRLSQSYEHGEEIVSPFLEPDEERIYEFQISKGLSLNNEYYNINRGNVDYSVNYFKYKINEYSLLKNVISEFYTEPIDNLFIPATTE